MLIIAKQKLDWFRKTFRSSLKFCVLKSSSTARHTHMHNGWRTHSLVACTYTRMQALTSMCSYGRRRRRKKNLHTCMYYGHVSIYSLYFFSSLSLFLFFPHSWSVVVSSAVCMYLRNSMDVCERLFVCTRAYMYFYHVFYYAHGLARKKERNSCEYWKWPATTWTTTQTHFFPIFSEHTQFFPRRSSRSRHYALDCATCSTDRELLDVTQCESLPCLLLFFIRCAEDRTKYTDTFSSHIEKRAHDDDEHRTSRAFEKTRVYYVCKCMPE